MEDDDDFDGFYDEDNADCDCSDYDTDLMLGTAWCHKCGRRWGLTAEEVKREIEFQAEYMAQFEQQRMSENEPIELSGVAEQLAEGGGAWRSCSGCHELNEGHPTGAWSNVLKCHLGLGCSECGGIGAVWDNTDYADFGKFMADDGAREEIRTQLSSGLESLCLWLLHRFGPESPEGMEANARLHLTRSSTPIPHPPAE